ncbi:MAG: hypothetical protein MUC74_10605 [Ideonella sp.]|nr:hypothetical protein [Ideonella sp.]
MAVAEGVGALFPCRVERRSRDAVPLGDARVPMEQLACSAQGMTFAVSRATLPERADAQALQAVWVEVAGRNLGATPHELGPRFVRASGGAAAGAPVPARRLSISGRLPDGTATRHELLVFAHRQGLYHAAVLGAAPANDAVEAFFDGLEVKR